VLRVFEGTKTISQKTITTRELGQHLRECGYTNHRLQENYTYADSSGEYTVPLVGFAHETFDARDACLAGLDANSEGVEQLQALVGSYRGLGAPVVFACRQKELQWWTLTVQGPEFKETVSADHVANFFDQHRKQFSPKTIYLAKTRGRLDSQYQLSFVDVGLMPLFEQEMGDHLSRLIKRMCGAILNELGNPAIDENLGRWLFQCVFGILAAKILGDKNVSEFSDLNLDDVRETLREVHNHYNAGRPPEQLTPTQEKGLKAAAQVLKKFGSLRHLTIESLAYVYENALITKEIRKALAIHATPAYLVDYIVWQLAPWIEQIPQANRAVLEPTCGHAPFLVSAARLLREMINEDDRKKRHEYLKKHLLGIEMDSFAREIALLSLTLADVPNPNGWNLQLGNVFIGDKLSRLAQKATVLLCNPPFQDFDKNEKLEYGVNLKFGNKAAEVVAKTLPYMPTGSVFGVILPRGFLHKNNLASLREYIAKNFEIHEIGLLPENVFTSASHISCLILGRKVGENDIITKSNKVRYVRIPKDNLDEFRNTYKAETKIVNQAVGKKAPVYDFRLSILLGDVWEYCRSLVHLGDMALVGRGLEYKNVSNSTSRDKFKGAVQGFVKFSRTLKDKSGKWKKQDIKLTELPDLYWMDLSDNALSNPRYGRESGCPQVLANYARSSNTPWRLKALIDYKGRPVTNSFLVIRPQNSDWSLEFLWALSNSPLANAYAFCHCMERHNLESIIRNIPLPECNPSDLQNLRRLVHDYFALYQGNASFLQWQAGSQDARKRMLAIDAEIMRLYDLPPKLEKQLLDLFNGYNRKGVYFRFDRYYQKGSESYIPLHEYLSEEYQRSTVSFVSKWVEQVRSPEIIKALKRATEVFKEK
jgi:type I restriction-modification system DNA methylase subunit